MKQNFHFFFTGRYILPSIQNQMETYRMLTINSTHKRLHHYWSLALLRFCLGFFSLFSSCLYQRSDSAWGHLEVMPLAHRLQVPMLFNSCQGAVWKRWKQFSSFTALNKKYIFLPISMKDWMLFSYVPNNSFLY